MNKRVVIVITLCVVLLAVFLFFFYNKTTYYNLDASDNLSDSKVLSYGVINNQNPDSENKLIDESRALYQEYGENGKIFFVFGNNKGVSVASYEEVDMGKIGLVIGDSYNGFNVRYDQYLSKKILPNSNNVKIQIGGKDYEFNLKSGETSYFIIYENGKTGE